MTVQPVPGERPVQMRLGFDAPRTPVGLDLSLAGLTVLVDAVDDRWDECWQHLAAVGVAVRAHDGGGLAFGVRELTKLAELPDQVRVRVDDALAPLWAVVQFPPLDGLPATLERVAGELRLRWSDGVTAFDEACPRGCAPALLAGEVPFVATGAAWAALRAASELPVVAGRCRVNHDGFVEITTTKPQLVEGAPIPGLFRLDETHYGVAAEHAGALESAPGFVWEGPRPRLAGSGVDAQAAQHVLDELGVDDASATRAGVDAAERLGGCGATAIAGGSDGWRIAVTVAAVAAAELTSVLVVCPAWGMAVWSGLAPGWQVLSYDELAGGAAVRDPGVVVFVDPCAARRLSSSVDAAVIRVQGVRDAARIVVTASAPADAVTGVWLGALLRPGEFRPETPLALRYPGRPEQRAREHLGAYLGVTGTDEPSVPGRGGGVELHHVDVTHGDTPVLLARAAGSAADAVRRLDAVQRVLDLGTSARVGPKLADGVAAARAAVAAGRRVVLATRSSDVARRAVALLEAARVRAAVADDELPLDSGVCAADVVVVRYSTSLSRLASPALGRRDAAVLLEADPEVGPVCAWVRQGWWIVIVHAGGTIDDVLAGAAARGSWARTDASWAAAMLDAAVWPARRPEW